MRTEMELAESLEEFTISPRLKAKMVVIGTNKVPPALLETKARMTSRETGEDPTIVLELEVGEQLMEVIEVSRTPLRLR